MLKINENQKYFVHFKNKTMKLPKAEDLHIFKINEIYQLRKIVLLEIERRNKREKTKAEKKHDLIKYGTGLISFIEASTGYNIKSKSRKQHLVLMRNCIFNHMKNLGLSLTEIGKLFRKDHASVIHGLMKFKYYFDSNDEIFYKEYNLFNELKENYDNTTKNIGTSKSL